MADLDDKYVPLTPAEQRIQNERAWAVPGTNRGNEIYADTHQQSFLENVKAGFEETAASAGARLLTQEAQPLADQTTSVENPVTPLDFAKVRANEILAGGKVLFLGEHPGDPDYDKDKEYTRLTEGIPLYLHDEIMQADSLTSAERARARVLDDIDRGRRMSVQRGISPMLAIMAGSVADVDLPLALFTGGGYKAATVAGKALRVAEKAGMSTKWASRASSASIALNSGLQSGLITGAAKHAWDETSTWADVAETALQSMVFSGVLGGAVHGDKAITIRAAQDEFHSRIASNHPNLTDDFDILSMETSPVLRDEPFVVDSNGNFVEVPPKAVSENAEKQSINAAANPDSTATKFQATSIADPTGTVSNATQDIIRNAQEWRFDSGFDAAKAQANTEWWGKLAQHPAFNLYSTDINTMFKSKAATLNYFAGEILESPNGLFRGRATAAVLKEVYHPRITRHLASLEEAALDYAKRNQQTWRGTGVGIANEGKREFNRRVMLELNNRRLGKAADEDGAIRSAADAIDRASKEDYDINIGKQGQVPVDGFLDIKYEKGYTPYVWDGRTIVRALSEGTVERSTLVNAVAQGYTAALKMNLRDAQKVAEAVITRAISRDVDVDTSLAALLSGDGREFLRESLTQAGVDAKEVEHLINRFTGDAMERGKESYAKGRNELDLSIAIPTKDGSTMQLVDLMDQDLHQVWQRRARRTAGTAALARKGLNNQAKIKDFINAVQQEQRALGETPMPRERLEAILSPFHGGPISGYSLGIKNDGVGAEISLLKRMSNLSFLGKMGIPQLGEAAAAISQMGLNTWVRRGPAAAFDAQMKAANKELLQELSFFMGDIGQEHRNFAPHLDLDDMTRSDQAGWLHGVNRMTQKMQWLQNYTSGFNLVRSYEQRIAVLGMVDKVMRTIKQDMDKGDFGANYGRFQNDLGLYPEDISKLQDLIENGTIEFAEHNGYRYVNRLNIEKWNDPEFEDVFMSAISRNMNQVVQKSLAGEQSVWMNTHVGSIITHLKTFPMAAIQKQFVRNLRYMDQQSLATLMYGMATAWVALRIRDAIDGKERSTEDQLRQAFSYANLTGWVPMYWDPTMNALGLENARINPYGPVSSYVPPTVTWFDRASRVPGALVDKALGQDNSLDRQAIRALPFASTAGLPRLFDY